MPPINWYYKVNGEEHGPVTSGDLRQMAIAGTLRPSDSVRKEEMGEWVRASQLRGLEFANGDYDAYDEAYDPDDEMYDNAQYARSRAVREHYGHPGFGLRLVAHLMDVFMTGLIGFASFMLLVVAMAVSFAINDGDQRAMQSSSMIMGFLFYVVLGLAILFYYVGMESSKLQGTIGKLLLGLKITDLNGERISFLRALGRNLCKFFSAVPLGAGYLMILFTDKKQALHDMLTGCQIVQK